MNIAQLKKYGFAFDGYKGVLDPNNMSKMAADAQLITTPNTGVPAEYTAYIDPEVIRILTAPLRARAIAKEVQKGNRASSYAKFKVIEQTGYTQPYDDFADNGASDYNVNYPKRDNYLFETTIKYGDLEEEVSAMAKIQHASEKQLAAANTIDIATNNFYFYGVEGLDNYGLLNDPNLPAAITPNTGTAGSALWNTKTALEIFRDIQKLVADLITKNKGLVDENSVMKLTMPPEQSVYITDVTEFGVSVKKMIAEAYPNMEIVKVPQNATASGNLMQLYVPNIDSTDTALLGFSAKMIAGRVIAALSHFKQKFSAGTYGAIIQRPVGISQMLGI